MKNFKGSISRSHPLISISILLMALKSKFKIAFFPFFCEHHIVGSEIVKQDGLDTYTRGYRDRLTGPKKSPFDKNPPDVEERPSKSMS